ncbi:phosphoribosyltransferase family protein [Roseovarius sp.]|uniref:phosphoribosyltransferase family protein n=1 Tax=Roseovarius sp. TaxID=1486281 RepID=UPI002616A0FB|nr:phosphoribosyltransferase family protein [Roseovarius sp.]MDW3118013.1 phosphoribosyltransferase family protein [Roseovarius pacificus]
MGIVVTERIEEGEDTIFDVTIDLRHNDGVDMSLSGNPTVMTVDDLHVFSLFRRRRLSTTEADGNPLIYALKELKGYAIDEAGKELMWETAGEIFRAWTCPWKPTHIVSIPSRHSVSIDLASKIAAFLEVEHVPVALVHKKTVAEVLEEAETLKDSDAVSGRDLKAFKNQLGRLSTAPPGKTFQMKEIDVRVRQYFHPWRVAEEAKDLIGHDLLLVDDLIGTGASLSTCAKCLVENGHSVVGGMSLFSPLDRELAKKSKGARRKRRRGGKP